VVVSSARALAQHSKKFLLSGNMFSRNSLGIVRGCACSAALVAYGLESFVDLWASVLVLWRFWEDETTEAGMRKNHDRENRADVGIAFTVSALAGSCHAGQGRVGLLSQALHCCAR